MDKSDYIIRENGMSELISKSFNQEFLELDVILENYYPYILKSIKKENYYIELGISDFFEEILYENKVVGFVIFDIVNEINIRIIDCYILPEFRGKRLFFNELEKLIFLGSKVSFLQPTRSLVELLLDFAYAKKVTDNIVVSAFDFDFEEFDLKTNTNRHVFGGKSSNFYDLSICSTILVDNEEVFYHKSLKNDVISWGDRKQLTDDYFNQIKELFTKKHDEYYHLVSDLKKELPQLTLGYNEIVGQGEDLSAYMQGMVDEGYYTYEEALNIKNKLKEEYESGKLLTDEDVNRRLVEILNEDIKEDYNSEDINEIFSFRDVVDFSDEDNDFLDNIQIENYHVDEDLANAVSNLLLNRDDNLDEDSKKVKMDLINYLFSDDSIIDDDLFPAIDFRNSDDREIYFEYLLEKNNDKQYKLDNTLHKSEYPVIYNLAMFEFLKLYNKNNDFIKSIINVECICEDYEEDEVEDLLVKKGYLDGTVDYENWDDFADKFLTVSNLKDFLRNNNLKVSGRKQELIDRVRENNLSLDEFETYDYKITDKGIQYMKDNEWMKFYNIFLQPFEFDDFFRYYNSHNGDIEDIAYDYLDELFELGKKNNNSALLEVIVKIKKIINHYCDKFFTNPDIFE